MPAVLGCAGTPDDQVQHRGAVARRGNTGENHLHVLHLGFVRKRNIIERNAEEQASCFFELLQSTESLAKTADSATSLERPPRSSRNFRRVSRTFSATSNRLNELFKAVSRALAGAMEFTALSA